MNPVVGTWNQQSLKEYPINHRLVAYMLISYTIIGSAFLIPGILYRAGYRLGISRKFSSVLLGFGSFYASGNLMVIAHLVHLKFFSKASIDIYRVNGRNYFMRLPLENFNDTAFDFLEFDEDVFYVEDKERFFDSISRKTYPILGSERGTSWEAYVERKSDGSLTFHPSQERQIIDLTTDGGQTVFNIAAAFQIAN